MSIKVYEITLTIRATGLIEPGGRGPANTGPGLASELMSTCLEAIDEAYEDDEPRVVIASEDCTAECRQLVPEQPTVDDAETEEPDLLTPEGKDYVKVTMHAKPFVIDPHHPAYTVPEFKNP